MGNITFFTDDSFIKSIIFLDIKKERKLKYYNVTLPEVTNRKHGFHIESCRQFIALPKSHRGN